MDISWSIVLNLLCWNVDDLTLFLDLLEWTMDVPMVSVLLAIQASSVIHCDLRHFSKMSSLGGLVTEEWLSKRCLLYLGTALLSSSGIYW